jgi:heme oxygenase
MTTNTDLPVEQLPMSARFKQGHADLHEQAEHGTIPAAMAAGTITRDQYIGLLQTEYHVHRVLDERLVASKTKSPLLDELIDHKTLMSGYYAEDLKHFGIDPETIEPTPAAAEVIELIHTTEREHPLALLAFHYVRFGATNGNRYVAKRIRPALGLESIDSAPGTKHLDPFGKEQRPLWDAFKAKLDAATISEDERQLLVHTARHVFTAIMSLHAEVSGEPTHA